ncbi:hypothetical protein [Geobacter sp.]|uniref:hypothetical protein n=1 Tax=Geobacter sp. TaxID=46610 RepID=UPI0027B942DC|nr:hypothetical protein [Geobacter sp.]
MSDQTDYTALAGVLDRLEASRLNDGPVLTRIEKNTSILPRIFSESLRQARSIKESPRPVAPKVERTAPAVVEEAIVAPSVPVATADATIVKPSPPTVAPVLEPQSSPFPKEATADATVVKPSPAIVVAPDAPPVAPVTNTEKPKTTTVNATRTPAPLSESRQRDQQGRFKSQAAMAEVHQGREQERQRKGIIGALMSAMKSKTATRKVDADTLQDATGKAAGGPFWEAGKELAEAAGEIREKIHDDKTITGRTWKAIGRRFGLKGKDQTTLAVEKGEKAEQKRHRELLQAVENSRGGGGEGGGALDAIDDALDIFGNLKRAKKSPLDKLPGGGGFAVGLGSAISASVVGALAVGFAGVMSIIRRGKENGWHDTLRPDQTRAITGQGPSEADRKRWRDSMPKGNVVSATPGQTTVKHADGTIERRTGTRAWRNNNPGNIEYGPHAIKMGATGSDGRFAVFPDEQTGRRAQEKLIFEGDSYRNRTLSEAINRYAPPGENDTRRYQREVLASVGGKNKRMSDYTPAERQKILDAMKRVEGNRPGKSEIIGKATTQAPNPPGRDGGAARSGQKQRTATADATDAKKETRRKGSRERTTARGGKPPAKEPTVVAQAVTSQPVPAVPRPVKQIEAPPPEPAAPAPAPQVAGMDQLLAAVERLADAQKPKGQEKETPQIIKTEFDDTTLVLMCYDRI